MEVSRTFWGRSVIAFIVAVLGLGAAQGVRADCDLQPGSGLPTPRSVRGLTFLGTVVEILPDVPARNITTFRVKVKRGYAGSPDAVIPIVSGCDPVRLEQGGTYLISWHTTMAAARTQSNGPFRSTNTNDFVVWSVGPHRQLTLLPQVYPAADYPEAFRSVSTLNEALDLLGVGALPSTDANLGHATASPPSSDIGGPELLGVMGLATLAIQGRTLRRSHKEGTTRS